MFSKALCTALVALATSTLVTGCNPMKRDCPPDPAVGQNKVTCDFTQGPCAAFESLGTPLQYNGNGCIFNITEEGNAPGIETGKYIFGGRVDVVVQAAPGAGIVTNVVLISDALDEIAWEWIGIDNSQVKTYYFHQGDDTGFDHSGFHSVSNPTGSFHTYTIEWTHTAVTWSIDSKVVRYLGSRDVGSGFPQTPMQVMLSTSAVGHDSPPQHSVEWASGYTDFSQAPFVGYMKNVSVIDYAGGDGPTSRSVKEYIYSDKSGTWRSIQAV